MTVASIDVRTLLKKTKGAPVAWPRDVALDVLSDANLVKLAASPQLANVRSLTASSGRIGVKGAKALATSPYVANLEVLALPQCHMNDAALTAIASSPMLGKLRALNITWNEFKARGWKALVATRSLTSLVELRVASNKLGAAGWKALLTSPLASRVEVLDLSMTWPKEPGIDALLKAKLPRLRELAMVWVDLRVEHVKQLVRWPVLPRLSALNLGHNFLGAEGIALLFASGVMGSMESLVLRATGIPARMVSGKVVHGADGFESLARAKPMPGLRLLDLSGMQVDADAARILIRAPLLSTVRELFIDGQLDDETVSILRDRFGDVAKLPPPRPRIVTAPVAEGEAVAERVYVPVAELAAYPKQKPFAHWRPDRSAAIVAAATKLVVDASKALLALGEGGTVRRQKKVLEECTRAFNDLERKHHFITTIEAEDISEAIDHLADHTRLWGSDDVAKAWRDW